MERINENNQEFRFKDHGPKYMFRGPYMEWGIIVLKPGQDLGAHLHNETEETFYIVEGTPIMTINNNDHRTNSGDAFKIDPKEPHNLTNDTNANIKVIFLKVPYNPEDKVSLNK
ncbi:MAG: cupin domain-containing protein [bacterium]|nr:cupin domain-containing protein [bacterium]